MDPKMEDLLVAWIQKEQEDTSQLLTRSQIKKKAKEISNVKSFKASKGWLDKFRRRHSIKFRPAISESQIHESEIPDSESSATGKLEGSLYESSGSNKENEEELYCEESPLDQQSFTSFVGK